MSYLPLTDDGLRTWAENFSDQLGLLADPMIVGISLAQVTEYSDAFSDYATKLKAANGQTSRSGATVLAKNESKEALVALSREFAMTVQHFPGVTDEQRYAFGLTIPDTERSAVLPPAFAPDIDVFPANVLTVKIRLHNEQTLGRRGKPEGAIGATIFSYVGELPPALDDVKAWKFEMNTGETTAEITFPSTVPAGSTVWITATWYNRRGEQSPATPAVNVNLPGTLQQAA